MNNSKIRNVILSLTTIGLAYILGLIAPWWSIVPLCVVLGFFSGLVPLKAFSFGFFCIFAAWFLQIYLIDAQNEGILSSRIISILDGISVPGLFLISSSLGGLGGGISFAFGASLAPLRKKSE